MEACKSPPFVFSTGIGVESWLVVWYGHKYMAARKVDQGSVDEASRVLAGLEESFTIRSLMEEPANPVGDLWNDDGSFELGFYELLPERQNFIKILGQICYRYGISRAGRGTIPSQLPKVLDIDPPSVRSYLNSSGVISNPLALKQERLQKIAYCRGVSLHTLSQMIRGEEVIVDEIDFVNSAHHIPLDDAIVAAQIIFARMARAGIGVKLDAPWYLPVVEGEVGEESKPHPGNQQVFEMVDAVKDNLTDFLFKAIGEDPVKFWEMVEDYRESPDPIPKKFLTGVLWKILQTTSKELISIVYGEESNVVANNSSREDDPPGQYNLLLTEDGIPEEEHIAPPSRRKTRTTPATNGKVPTKSRKK